MSRVQALAAGSLLGQHAPVLDARPLALMWLGDRMKSWGKTASAKARNSVNITNLNRSPSHGGSSTGMCRPRPFCTLLPFCMQQLPAMLLLFVLLPVLILLSVGPHTASSIPCSASQTSGPHARRDYGSSACFKKYLAISNLNRGVFGRDKQGSGVPASLGFVGRTARIPSQGLRQHWETP